MKLYVKCQAPWQVEFFIRVEYDRIGNMRRAHIVMYRHIFMCLESFVSPHHLLVICCIGVVCALQLRGHMLEIPVLLWRVGFHALQTLLCRWRFVIPRAASSEETLGQTLTKKSELTAPWMSKVQLSAP